MEDSDEDKLTLSSDALAALQEFYTEKDTQQKRFEELKAAAEKSHQGAVLSMDIFTEDWNASQFWYSDETAATLARELLDGTTSESAIAVISAPSVFIQIKNLVASGAYPDAPRTSLLEFDERFSVFQEFVQYKFQTPLKLAPELKGSFDRIICDPPFLSSDCQTKAAMTVRWLSKEANAQHLVKVIVCTGERMESLILKLYPGIQTTNFEPQHAQGRLSNEFRCYTNFESPTCLWK